MVYAEPDRRGPCTVKDTSSCFSAGEIRSVKEVTFTRYSLPLVVLAHGLGLMVHGNAGDAVTFWILLFALSLPKGIAKQWLLVHALVALLYLRRIPAPAVIGLLRYISNFLVLSFGPLE